MEEILSGDTGKIEDLYSMINLQMITVSRFWRELGALLNRID